MLRRRSITLLLLIFCFTSLTQARQPTAKHEFLFQDSLTVYRYDADTGTRTKLIEQTPDDYASWLLSPNGKYLIKHSDPLIVYDIDAQAWIEGISLPTDGFGGVAWSPDSTKFAYSTYVNNPTYPVSRGQLWIFDLKTMNSRLLYDTKAASDGQESDPISYHPQWGVGDIWWNPDGKELLFVEYYWIMGGTINWLDTISIGGKGPSNFSSGDFGATFEIAWSPDGKSMLFYKHTADFNEIVLVDPANKHHLLTDTPDTWKENLRWSPDGEIIQFDTFDQTISIDFQSVLRDPKSIKTTVIPRAPRFYFPSSDNQYLAYIDVGRSDDGFDTYNLFVTNADGANGIKIGRLIAQRDFLGWRPS